MGTREKITLINFPGGRKNWKNGHFWHPLHKSKLTFHAYEVDIQNFYEFTNLNSSKIAMTTRNFKKIYWLKVLQNWMPEKLFFSQFFWFTPWFLRSMGAVAQNWLIPQKFHKNQNCRVSKSKIIMGLWSVALNDRKAAKSAANSFSRVWLYYSTLYIKTQFLVKWIIQCIWMDFFFTSTRLVGTSQSLQE